MKAEPTANTHVELERELKPIITPVHAMHAMAWYVAHR